MLTRLRLLSLLLFCIPVLQPACTDPCDLAMTVVDRGEALLPEANTAIVQATRVISSMPDSNAKREALDALRDAELGLRIAQGLLDDARQLCAAPNLAEVFRTFARAWDALKPFVGSTGGAAGYVPDPKAYSIGMGR